MGAMDREHRREIQEMTTQHKLGNVENPWYRFTNKVDKWISSEEAKRIKETSQYKQAYRGSMGDARGGGGVEGDLSDPYGRYDGSSPSGDLGFGFDMGFMDDIYGGMEVGDSNVSAPSLGDSYEGNRGGYNFSDAVANTKFSDLGDMASIQTGIDTELNFTSSMMSSLTPETFSEQFGEIGSYADFQKSIGDFGFESLGVEDMANMTRTQAQTYIDEMSAKVTQRFDAFSKTSLLDNVSDLQDMVTEMNLRTVETYDTETATVGQRMTFNSAVRDLQATGVNTEIQEDVRMSDISGLALSTASLLTGNPMGLVSSAYQVSKLTDMSRLSPMGQLAQYGKFTDPSLSGLNLTRSEIGQLGQMQGEIQDFAKTVETAEQNRELDERIQSFNRKSNDAETRQGAIIQNIESSGREQEASIDQPTSEVQGSTRVTKRGNLGYSRDVSNKGLGDVVSVFGQIDSPNEDDIQEDNVGFRFSLANLFGRF